MNKKRAEIRKIVSNLFIRLLSILAEEKINIGEQLRTFGLSRQEIDDLAENIDYETFYLFTEHILATHSIPAMGARFGASLNISDWGMFGTGILSCESLWGAYQTFGEVQEYTGDLVKLDCTIAAARGSPVSAGCNALLWFPSILNTYWPTLGQTSSVQSSPQPPKPS